VAAIENQVRLAIVTSLLVALLVHHRMGRYGIEDEKALRKHSRRQTSKTDGTDRPDCSAPIFRYTSKASRQVLRFFKHCSHRSRLYGSGFPTTENSLVKCMTWAILWVARGKCLYYFYLSNTYDVMLAERAGFEPALGYYPKHAFQACDLNHSSISPQDGGV
jgi:hypothetical protein